MNLFIGQLHSQLICGGESDCLKSFTITASFILVAYPLYWEGCIALPIQWIAGALLLVAVKRYDLVYVPVAGVALLASVDDAAKLCGDAL